MQGRISFAMYRAISTWYDRNYPGRPDGIRNNRESALPGRGLDLLREILDLLEGLVVGLDGAPDLPLGVQDRRMVPAAERLPDLGQGEIRQFTAQVAYWRALAILRTFPLPTSSSTVTPQ
jgi:hypothetical protein